MTSASSPRLPREDDDAPQISFTVQSWRRIVRTLLCDHGLQTLPCRRDLLLVAYDFAALCDVVGRGAYSSKERTGRALSDRPDASLCELTEISKLQTGKMLKLLIALGCLRQTKQASMGQQAVYQAVIPTGSPESVGRCLATAAQLGFKPKVSRDMSKQTAARRENRARAEALQVLADVPQMAVDEPVDNEEQGVVQTTPLEGHADDPPRGHVDDPQRCRTDDPPLPIGVLGTKGNFCSPLRTGSWPVASGARNGDQLEGCEGQEQPSGTASSATVDGQPSGNRWGAAVTQEAIRRSAGQRRMREVLAKSDRCEGLSGDGCPYDRPVSPSNDKGLCIRCYGLIAGRSDGVTADQPEHQGPLMPYGAPGPLSPKSGSKDGARS